jgi:hypothetical protein
VEPFQRGRLSGMPCCPCLEEVREGAYVVEVGVGMLGEASGEDVDERRVYAGRLGMCDGLEPRELGGRRATAAGDRLRSWDLEAVTTMELAGEVPGVLPLEMSRELSEVMESRSA